MYAGEPNLEETTADEWLAKRTGHAVKRTTSCHKIYYECRQLHSLMQLQGLGICDVKGSVSFVLKFALSPFCTPVPSVVQILTELLTQEIP